MHRKNKVSGPAQESEAADEPRAEVRAARTSELAVGSEHVAAPELHWRVHPAPFGLRFPSSSALDRKRPPCIRVCGSEETVDDHEEESAVVIEGGVEAISFFDCFLFHHLELPHLVFGEAFAEAGFHEGTELVVDPHVADLNQNTSFTPRTYTCLYVEFTATQ
jgi:hypothetical protein